MWNSHRTVGTEDGSLGWVGEDPVGRGIQLRAIGSQKMALRLGLMQLPGLGGHCPEGGMRDESSARECMSLDVQSMC